jgi:hypothetical protein
MENGGRTADAHSQVNGRRYLGGGSASRQSQNRPTASVGDLEEDTLTSCSRGPVGGH